MTTTRRTLLWVLVFLPFAGLALARWSEGPRLDEEDYAQYLLHARALAEGRPYTDIGFIFTPYNRYVGPVAEPPGLPVLLAPAVWAGGVDGQVVKLVMFVSAIVLLAIVARYYAVHEAHHLALGVTLLCLLQPTMIHLATEAMSDLPFMALVWATILVAEPRGAWTWRRAVALTALGAGAIAFRVAGVALIPALGVLALLRFRDARWWPLLPLAAWCATLYFVNHQTATMAALLPEVTLAPTRHASTASLTLRTYSLAVLGVHLYPFPWDRANDVYHLGTLFLAAVGLLVWLRRSWNTYLALVTASTVAMVVTIPTRDGRYLWPIAPVIVFVTLLGAATVLRRVFRSWPEVRANTVAVVTGTLLALSATIVEWTPVQPTGITTVPEVQELYAHLEATAAREPVRVMVFRPRILTLKTGIPAMPLFTAPAAAVVPELCTQRITHAVLGDLGQYPNATALLREVVARSPAAFTPDWSNTRFSVFRFTGECPA